MSKQLFLTRYLLLLNRLEQGPATYEDLKRLLERASNTRDKKLSVSRRTMQRDIKDIYEHFGIDIANERKGDRRYFIREGGMSHRKQDELLEAYRTVSIIQHAQEYATLIFPESRKSAGLEHFHGLLYAAREKRIIEFTYKKFAEDRQTTRRVHPLALKEAQRRWYLVGIDEKDQQLKTFGLDRISNLGLTRQKFEPSFKADLARLFEDFFGVLTSKTKKRKIILSFDPKQGQYVDSFPLHHSQKLIKIARDEMIFEVNLVPTHDFVQEIKSYGTDVEVIEPASLRHTIHNILARR